MLGNLIEKPLALASFAVLAAGIGVGTAPAGAADLSTSPVLSFSDAEMHGSSLLVRNPGGVTASLSSTSGVSSGDAVTLWFVVFNNPEYCVVPNACGEADLFFQPGAGPVENDVVYGTGHVVGNGDQAHFSAALNEDDTTGSLAGTGLLDSMKAEIHLIVRTHGPADHGGSVRKQIKTGEFGDGECPECADILFAVHQP